MHQINLFKITNLSNLRCCYRLIEVTNLPRDRAYGKNVNLLSKRLAYELQQPVALLSGEEHMRLAIPASSKLPELEQTLTPHVAILRPLGETHILDFDRLDEQTLPIAKSFLRSAFQVPLMVDLQLWGNNRYYYWNWTLNKMTTADTKIIANRGCWSRLLSSFLALGSGSRGALWDLFGGLSKIEIRSNPRINRLCSS